MGYDRRRFLKIAGAFSLAGLSGAGWQLLKPGALDAAQETPNPRALTARRWGMAIDLRKITPEIAEEAVKVCHALHNVPQIQGKQEIKWIWLAPFEHVFTEQEHPYVEQAIKEQEFLTLCNHCDNPPCVRVCPTQATFSREDGIVMMDMHRCIGCRFCMAACPYGSRSFNFMDPRPHVKEQNLRYPTRMRGVVEKCTFCTERLAVGLPPACVEVSQGSILFGDMSDAGSDPRRAMQKRYALRRKPSLGTNPQVFYLI